MVRADAAAAPAEAPAAKPAWTVPTLNPDTPSPIFGGSTGGLLRKAQVRRVAFVAGWRMHVEMMSNKPTPARRIAGRGVLRESYWLVRSRVRMGTEASGPQILVVKNCMATVRSDHGC